MKSAGQKPSLHGFSSPAFRPVERLLADQLGKSRGGAAVCVYLDRRPVVDLWGGVRDESGAPWQRDTACVAYSTTKGVIATALHILADRGLIDYDAPVARYWPEFAQSGKGAITVRSVLCHRAGLFNIRDLASARQMLDWDHMTGALAAARACPPSGKFSTYQALTWGYLVGELIRRVSGREVPEFVRTEIADPLGLDGLFVGGADVDVSRAARLIDSPARRSRFEQHPASDGDRRERRERRHRRRRNRRKYLWLGLQGVLRTFGHPIDLERMLAALAPAGVSRLDFSSDDVLRACIPSANGMFTARSLARLYAALAAGGSLDGARLLSPETLARASEIQIHGFDQITLVKLYWRLGYHGVRRFRGVVPGAFGHFGWGGSGAWADPGRRLSLGYVVNTGSGTPFGDLRITRLTSTAIACADRYRAT